MGSQITQEDGQVIRILVGEFGEFFRTRSRDGYHFNGEIFQQTSKDAQSNPPSLSESDQLGVVPKQTKSNTEMRQ